MVLSKRSKVTAAAKTGTDTINKIEVVTMVQEYSGIHN